MFVAELKKKIVDTMIAKCDTHAAVESKFMAECDFIKVIL